MDHDSKMETKNRRKKGKVKVLKIRSWVLLCWNGNVCSTYRRISCLYKDHSPGVQERRRQAVIKHKSQHP